MVKRIVCCSFLFALVGILSAGDVASFIDEGFSADGQTYVFGQYGSVDKTWQGYAEIYSVDIEENDYVDGGVFITSPSSKTAGKSGYTLYNDLRKKNDKYLENLSLYTVGIENVLYIAGDSKVSSESITIKDFEASTEDSSVEYSISLTPWFSGNTPSAVSSFFITVEKRDETGSRIGKQVIGNPDIKRKGVIGYAIERIIKSPDGESLIFIVEKTMATSSGDSIRYMVETLTVDSFK